MLPDELVQWRKIEQRIELLTELADALKTASAANLLRTGTLIAFDFARVAACLDHEIEKSSSELLNLQIANYNRVMAGDNARE